MKKRRKGNTGANLDSLLDTMTNVVGILVILLVVTQLGVGAAVKRIKGFVTEVSAEEFAATEDKANELNKLLEQENLSWKAIEPQIPRERLKIDELKKLIERLRRDLETIGKAHIDTEELQRQIEADRRRLKNLEREIDRDGAQVAKLRAQLDKTPLPEPGPSAKVINLPNPRSAPKGATRVIFICQNERVFPVNLEALQKKARRVIRRGGRALVKPDGTDCKRLVKLFENKKLGDDYLYIRIKLAGSRPMMMLHHREGRGNTAAQVKHRDSAFQRAVRSLNKEKQYARFMVWNDSFDVYLQARQIAQSYGLLAGWTAYDPSYVWQADLGVKVTCSTGKPPVKPKPPTAKPPTKPKPKPKPKPKSKPKPPLPSDEID